MGWRIGIAALAALLLVAPTQAITCQVSSPISATELNAGASWSFSVANATPNTFYAAKVQWAHDPSNGGHPSAGVETDAFGNGTTTLLRYWSSDGFLPGYFAFWDPYDPISGFVAVPGDFRVHVYPARDYEAQGNATCSGEVLP
jgi:hypothetical protein